MRRAIFLASLAETRNAARHSSYRLWICFSIPYTAKSVYTYSKSPFLLWNRLLRKNQPERYSRATEKRIIVENGRNSGESREPETKQKKDNKRRLIEQILNRRLLLTYYTFVCISTSTKTEINIRKKIRKLSNPLGIVISFETSNVTCNTLVTKISLIRRNEVLARICRVFLSPCSSILTLVLFLTQVFTLN